jgi:hypothetical protein
MKWTDRHFQYNHQNKTPHHTDQSNQSNTLPPRLTNQQYKQNPTGATPHALVNHLVDVYRDSEVRRRTLAGIELELQEHDAAAAATATAAAPQKQGQQEQQEEDGLLPLTSPRSGGRRRGRWWRLMRHRNSSTGELMSSLGLAAEEQEEGKEADAGGKPLGAVGSIGGVPRVGWSRQFWVLCKRSLLHT